MDCSDFVLCQELVRVLGMGSESAIFISLLISAVFVSLIPLTTVIGLIWLERKLAGRIQDRIGPNRVGPFGVFQTLADILKLLIKEDITPTNADRLIYNFAPILAFGSVILLWAVIPFSPYHVGVNLEMGALFFVAVASFGTLAIMMAGWASNNKYALLGAFRVVAQLISYEVPLVLALLIPVMLAGNMRFQDIIEAQSGMWFFFMAPVAALIFFISSQAETGRAPFDLLEAESEIVAGFNIEYSGMKFAMFFAGEFLHVFTNAVLVVILFFGGWLGPAAKDAPLLAIFYLFAKTGFFYFIFVLARNTLPRIRIDQLMDFNWKFLVPLSIVNVLVTSFLLKIMQLPEVNIAVDLNANPTFVSTLPMTVVLLIGNAVIVVGTLAWLRNQGREKRLLAEAAEMEAMAAAGAGD